MNLHTRDSAKVTLMLKWILEDPYRFFFRSQQVALCVSHVFFLSTCPCFCTHSCFLWPVSLGCPFSLLMPSSGFPSATWMRTEAACCTSKATERPLARLALQQRGLDTETGSYLPIESCLCVYVCVWQNFRSLHSSCHCWHEKGNMRWVLHCGM